MSGALHDASLFILLAGVPLVAVYANRSAQTLLALTLALTIAARIALPAERRGEPRELLMRPPLWVYLLLAGLAYATLSASWSIDPGFGLERGLKLFGLVGLTYMLWVLLPTPARRWHSEVAVPAIAVAALIAASELAAGGVFRPLSSTGHPSDLNRTLVTLTLLMWPAAALVAHGMRRMVAVVLLVMAVSLAILFSQSASAQLGLLVGVIAFLIALASASVVVVLLAAAAGLTFLGLPFAVLWGFDPLYATLSGLPFSTDTGVRLEIWRDYAEAIAYKPVFGWGIEATRWFGERDLGILVPGFIWDSASWHHPHNFVVQIWVELGALGAGIFAAATVLACLSIRNMRPERQPYACAFFAAAFSVAVVSHGAWQTWWLSVIAVAVLMLSLGHGRGAGPVAHDTRTRQSGES